MKLFRLLIVDAVIMIFFIPFSSGLKFYRNLAALISHKTRFRRFISIDNDAKYETSDLLLTGLNENQVIVDHLFAILFEMVINIVVLVFVTGFHS
jgi:hypothetical protein